MTPPSTGLLQMTILEPEGYAISCLVSFRDIPFESRAEQPKEECNTREGERGVRKLLLEDDDIEVDDLNGAIARAGSRSGAMRPGNSFKNDLLGMAEKLIVVVRRCRLY